MNEKRPKGLPDLHETLVDASEVLAAFIKAGRSGIVAPDILLEAAKKALHDTAAWRRSIKEMLDAGFGDEPPELH